MKKKKKKQCRSNPKKHKKESLADIPLWMCIVFIVLGGVLGSIITYDCLYLNYLAFLLVIFGDLIIQQSKRLLNTFLVLNNRFSFLGYLNETAPIYVFLSVDNKIMRFRVRVRGGRLFCCFSRHRKAPR